MLPNVLLLDLDDTILDDSSARDRCWEETCDEAARRNPAADAKRLRVELERVREEFWSDPDRALGLELGALHHELRKAAIAPLEGAIDTLHAFRERGVTLGLITNGGSEGQREKIERFALAAHFAYIGIEGEVGHGKPHRIAYQTALDALGVDADDCWMVGDNLEWHVAGAQAVGIRGIWLDKNGRGLPAGAGVVPDASRARSRSCSERRCDLAATDASAVARVRSCGACNDRTAAREGAATVSRCVDQALIDETRARGSELL